MEIAQGGPIASGPATRFSGEVRVDMIGAQHGWPTGMSAGVVHFAPGARTAWHAHARGQLLRIVEGSAILQARGGEPVRAEVGDSVWTPPSEWHWHGATSAGPMIHLALSATGSLDDGASVASGDHVADGEHEAADRATRPTAEDEGTAS